MQEQREMDGYCCYGGNLRGGGGHDLFSNYTMEDGDVLSATKALLEMYKKSNSQYEIYQTLEKVRLNPNLMNKNRDDLEYYVPQLINYLVFRENNDQLIDFLYYASQEDFYFAHLVYFQLNSLSAYVQKTVQQLPEVVEFLKQFTKRMQEIFQDQLLVSSEKHIKTGIVSSTIQNYGTGQYDNENKVQQKDMIFKQYLSIFNNPLGQGNNDGFNSTIDFWEDLMTISQRLHLADPQIISLKADVQRINFRLPATVYVPFVSDSIRNYVILNIVPTECKVFSTKERAPYYICLEIYRPEVEYNQQNDDLQLSQAITVQRGSQIHKHSIEKFQHRLSFTQYPLQIIEETESVPNIGSFYQDESDEQYASFKQEEEEFASVKSTFEQEKYHSDKTIKSQSSTLFGESSKEQHDRIRHQSPFGNFQSWRLVHLIVKSGDNLKQEQFAMQFLTTIDQIFALEALPIRLTTYEVLSLGPNYGIIEMVKDAITMDSLKRNLFQRGETFVEFFRNNFNQEQKLNFMHSLVGYSLACYVMQLKDRHNGNILLKRDGYLVHIDFGFFLGNAPGKGIELEYKVPFKLLTEQVEVLGGVESDLFDSFRKLFYRGFQALRKHHERIMLLVKMMYSGHSTTMPCFKKGDKCLIQLQERFYLDEQDDADINVICQNLINSSIDNWRARWYDKYQYYVQGIFY